MLLWACYSAEVCSLVEAPTCVSGSELLAWQENKFTHGSRLRHKTCFAPESLRHYWDLQNRDSDSLSHYRFRSLPWDSNPFLLCLSPLFGIYFLVCIDFQIEHYEGLPSPDVIQSNKKQELISYLCKMLHFPSSLRRPSQHYQSFDYPE